METRTKLSPAAQAVKNAVLALYQEGQVRDSAWPLERPMVAAALRAAADQVVEELQPGQSVWGEGYVEGVIFFRSELLAIAAELEAAQ